MSMRDASAAVLAVGLALLARTSFAETPNLGKPISEADIKAWSLTVFPDGGGLPPGSGTAAQGVKLFVEKGCIGCHGEAGKGGPGMALANPDAKLDRIEARKTIGNFWAQATTVFDVIRREMPWTQPRSLTDDESYKLTAYVLYLNKLVGENDVIDAQTLPKVEMPNKNNFIIRFPDQI
jgi:S-disulfanyl-L-cysteine oxidoreductase SoxD